MQVFNASGLPHGVWPDEKTCGDVRRVDIAVIQQDDSCWPRLHLDRARVDEFCGLYEVDGAEALPALPALELVPTRQDGFLLADGWHRLTALRRVGIEQVQVLVLPVADGEDPVAVAYRRALGCSAISAKPLTRAEKQHAVTTLIEMYPEASNRAIGRLAGVDHKTVGRAQARGDSPPEGPPPKRVVLPEVAAARFLAAFEKVREARGVGFMDWLRGGDRTGERMADLLWNRYGEDAASRAAEFGAWLEEARSLLESEAGEA
jgi:hypothetical protein